MKNFKFRALIDDLEIKRKKLNERKVITKI